MESGTAAWAALLIAALLTATLPWHGAAAATLIVPTDYPTIQAAIDAASPLDEVVVEPGTYTENLILRTQIDVRGREAARTLLEPENDQLATVSVTSVDDVIFSNFTLINASTAIEVSLSVDVWIANVVFDSAADAAIDVDLGSTVDVSNNVFFGNAVAILRDTIDVFVVNNIFRGNDVTLTTLNPLVDNDVNVEANCWSDNADLGVGGVDAGYGAEAVVGDPLFVDPDRRDFHLEQDSPCIDIGIGTDFIDGTDADAGAYGGELADVQPYPVEQPTLTDTSTNSPEVANVLVEWTPNSSYLVTNSVLPGSYRVYYELNSSGPPYEGTDAGAGTEPSPIDVGDAASYTLSDLMPTASPPGTTQLLTAEARNEAVILTWDPAAGANDYRVHYGIASTDENQVDTGDVTTFTVTGLSNGTTYRFAVSALAQSTYYVAVTAMDSTQGQHESDFSEEQSIDVGGAQEGPLSNELTALPESVLAYPVLPDEDGCFIATAAYGADWEAEVQILRDFRDRYLLPHAPGQWFVEQYYRRSPPVADYLRAHAGWRATVRWMLAPLVGVALFLLGSATTAKLGTGALVIGLAIRIRRRRKASRRIAAHGLTR